MCAPPKIAVFVFVLTIHLAILAFAFPRLDLSGPAQSTAATSIAPATAAQPSSPTDAKVNAGQPSAEPKAHMSPVQHHKHEKHGIGQDADEKRRGPTVTHDLHQHSLAENEAIKPQQPEAAPPAETMIATPSTKPDRVVTTLPAQARPSISVANELVAEPTATAKPTLNAVALTKAEQPKMPADAVSIPKPKPVAASRPTTANSTKAGSGRMSNLRQLKAGSR